VTLLLDLPDRLREYGVEHIVELAGWRTRGYRLSSGVQLSVVPGRWITLRHWTAGGSGHAPSLGIVTNGRSDLPGPLAQVLQARGGGPGGKDIVYVIAAGVANHGGSGVWNGNTSANYYGTGNEIEWSGPGESFSAMRIDISERVAAALLSYDPQASGQNACEHREYAPSRKIDTNLDGNVFRQRVSGLLVPANHEPEPEPESIEEDDDMPKMYRKQGSTGLDKDVVRIVAGPEVISLTGASNAQVNAAKKFCGMKTSDSPQNVPAKLFNALDVTKRPYKTK
jgi:hypothetical protein